MIFNFYYKFKIYKNIFFSQMEAIVYYLQIFFAGCEAKWNG